MKYVMLAVMMIMSGCSVVGPGERGVRVSLGKTSDDAKPSGAYAWIPFLLGMKKIDVRIQKSEVEASASSKDMQEIKTHVAVNWNIDPDKVVSTYKTIGDESDVLDRVISPSVSEAFKAAMSKRTAEGILDKRMELKQEIDNLLKDRLQRYGVTLLDVSIVNLTFSEEFSKAIEAKQIAEQTSKQAEYEAQKAKVDAGAAVNKARGLADSALIAAQAESQANKLKLLTLTPQLIQYEAVRRWDGKTPTVMGGNGGMMFNLPLGTKENK